MKQSSNIYMMDPLMLRSLGVELMERNSKTAFRSHPTLRNRSDSERAEAWDDLKSSIDSQGFLLEFPIEIHLNRKTGKDQIAKDGGHHRLAIAIELGLEEVPVRFLYE